MAFRSLYNIYTDIKGLNSTQKTNIWNDLNSGTPAKITLDLGPASMFIAMLWGFGHELTGLTAADLAIMKIMAATYYVWDNPNYLVNPSFDPSINVAGGGAQ
jgi:hypothetical protein